MVGELSRAEKRKYALALRRIDYGIWGYSVKIFYEMTLTTREGDDNTTIRFGKNIGKLIKWMRGLGYEVEYCGIYELSPRKGLLHWHGLLRIKGGFLKLYEGKAEKVGMEHKRRNRRALGDKWNEIHNAFVVEIKKIEKVEYLKRYINKHMVKDYLSEGVIRNKFLVSKDWMRRGYKELIGEFKFWWQNGSGEVWMSKLGWTTLNDMLKRWCEGKSTIVKAKFGYFKLVDGIVREATIYKSEVENG